MSIAVRLLPMICACVVAQAFAGGPAPSSTESRQSAAESPPAAPAGAPAQSSPSSITASDKPGVDPKSSAPQEPTTTSAAATGSAPAKVTLVDKTLTDAQVKQLLARGYKPQGHGEDVVYCRREQQLDSHFERKICRSAAQIMQEQLNSKEMTETLQRTQPSASGR